MARMSCRVDQHLHDQLGKMMDAINRCSEDRGEGHQAATEAESEGDCVARLRGFDVEVRESSLVGGGRGVFVSNPRPPPLPPPPHLYPAPAPASGLGPSVAFITPPPPLSSLPPPLPALSTKSGVIKAGSIICLFAGRPISRWSLFKAELGSSLISSSYYKDNEYVMDRSSYDGTCVDGQTIINRRTSLNQGRGSDCSFSGSLVNHPSIGSETNATFYHSRLYLPPGTYRAMSDTTPCSPPLPSPPLSDKNTCRECITLVIALKDLLPGEEVFTDYGLSSDQGSREDLPKWYQPVSYPEGSFETFTRSSAPEPDENGM